MNAPIVVPAKAGGTHNPLNSIVATRRSPALHDHQHRWPWVPAFAGTTYEARGASQAEQPRVLRLVPQAGEVGAKSRTAEIVQRCRERAFGCRRNDRLEADEHALAIGLAQRYRPSACGNQFETTAWKSACSASSSDIPCAALTRATATG